MVSSAPSSDFVLPLVFELCMYAISSGGAHLKLILDVAVAVAVHTSSDGH